MKVILVSHGSFSKGLFETMEMVLGEQQNLSYVGLYPHQGVDILKENIEKEFTKADEGEEILVLTDLFPEPASTGPPTTLSPTSWRWQAARDLRP